MIGTIRPQDAVLFPEDPDALFGRPVLELLESWDGWMPRHELFGGHHGLFDMGMRGLRLKSDIDLPEWADLHRGPDAFENPASPFGLAPPHQPRDDLGIAKTAPFEEMIFETFLF